MRDLRVKVRLTTDTKEATRNTDSARKSFGSLFASLRRGAAGVAAAVAAFAVLTRTLRDASEAAKVQEAAVTRLNVALGQTGGDAVANFSGALQQQAADLQRLGRAGDESLISIQALLLQMGVAPERIRAATEASLDLSSAFGISLEQAARNIGRTVGGLAGELGELIPELKTLQAEGRLAGEGIEFLADKFKGAAAGQIDTYESALNRLNDTLGDTSEALGESQNSPGVVTSMNRLERSVSLLGRAVTDSRLNAGLSSLKSFFIESKRDAVESTVAIGQWLGLLRSSEEIAKSSAAARAELAQTTGRVAQETERLARAEEYVNSLARESLERAKEQTEAQLARLDAQEKFAESLKSLGVTLEAEANEKIRENIDLLRDADLQYRQGAITRADFEAIERAVADANRELNDELKRQNGELDNLSDRFQDAGENARQFGDQVDELTSRLDRGTTAATRFSQVTRSGIVARDRRSQADVDQALAAGNRPFLGGTRIRTANGGSRLLS